MLHGICQPAAGRWHCLRSPRLLQELSAGERRQVFPGFSRLAWSLSVKASRLSHTCRVHQALHRRSDRSEKDLAEVSHSHLSRRSCRGSASYQVGCKVICLSCQPSEAISSALLPEAAVHASSSAPLPVSSPLGPAGACNRLRGMPCNCVCSTAVAMHAVPTLYANGGGGGGRESCCAMPILPIGQVMEE